MASFDLKCLLFERNCSILDLNFEISFCKNQNSPNQKRNHYCCNQTRKLQLAYPQMIFFLEKLRRDIDLILFASWNSANLCCIKIFSASGRIRWRHCYIRSMYFEIYIDRMWWWRHRTWPEAEKIVIQHKFAEFHDAKKLRSISLLSFSRKKKNWPPFKKIST